MKEEFVPRVSSRLQKKINEIKDIYTGWYGESKRLILEAYNIAVEEDKYAPNEAYKLLKQELSDICSPRIIREYIPYEAKAIKHSPNREPLSVELEEVPAIITEESSTLTTEEIHELEALREGFRIAQEQTTELQKELAATKTPLNLQDEDIALLMTLLQEAIDEPKYRHFHERIEKLLLQFQKYIEPVFAQEDMKLK